MSTDPKYKQGLNGNHGLGTQELYSDSKAVEVDFKRFYGLEPRHVDRRFTVKLSDLSYLPKVRKWSFASNLLLPPSRKTWTL